MDSWLKCDLIIDFNSLILGFSIWEEHQILYLIFFSKLIKIMNSNGYLDSINYFLKRIVIEILLIYFDFVVFKF